MDTNNGEPLDPWVAKCLSALDPHEHWQPEVSAGLARFHQKLSRRSQQAQRWAWALACAMAVILLALVILPSPHAFAHKCLECSVAVWQTLAASKSDQRVLTPHDARKLAPDFSLQNADGNEVKLSGLKGKVVLLNFWATWCHGCQTEISWLAEFQKKYGARGLVVVGISMDDDGWTSVKPWLDQRKVNYPIVIGSVRLGKEYGLDGMPLTVLVDRQGRVADNHPGIIDKAATEQKLQTLLN